MFFMNGAKEGIGKISFFSGRCVTSLPQICLNNSVPVCHGRVWCLGPLTTEEKMRTSFSKCVLVWVVVIGMTSFGVAQRTTATFAGIVTDPTSAVLPGASVQL